MKRSAEVGTLIPAPARASSVRRPTRAVTWAMPKQSELRIANRIAKLGLRQAQPPLDDLARRRERHLGNHDQALGQLVLRHVFLEEVVDPVIKRNFFEGSF